MPPYMKYLPSEPAPSQQGSSPVNTHPSHHCNSHYLPQFTEDRGTMSLPFVMRSESWYVACIQRAILSSMNVGFTSQTSLLKPYQPNQTKYKPYYQ